MSFYASEKCFRRYENIIATALEKYPESVRFKSPSRQNTTDSARCTNAISSYALNQWPCQNPIFAYFESRPLSVWMEKDYCVIGPAINKTNVEIIAGVGDGMHGSVKVMPQHAHEVVALVNMVNAGVFTDPLELPKQWTETAEAASAGMINIAIRKESNSIIIF